MASRSNVASSWSKAASLIEVTGPLPEERQHAVGDLHATSRNILPAQPPAAIASRTPPRKSVNQGARFRRSSKWSDHMTPAENTPVLILDGLSARERQRLRLLALRYRVRRDTSLRPVADVLFDLRSRHGLQLSMGQVLKLVSRDGSRSGEPGRVR